MAIYKYDPDERIDPYKMRVNHAEVCAHLNRYDFAAQQISHLRLKNQPLKVLDIACGLGYGSNRLSQINQASITGVDISRPAISYAKKNYSALNIDFITGNITRIDRLNRQFDFIISFETIEHITYKDAQIALKAMYKSLTAGGWLLIGTPNRYFTGLLAKIGWTCKFHYREYTHQEFKTMLSNAGFKPIQTFGQTCIFPLTYFPARANWLPDRYFYPTAKLPAILSQNFLCLAKK